MVCRFHERVRDLLVIHTMTAPKEDCAMVLLMTTFTDITPQVLANSSPGQRPGIKTGLRTSANAESVRAMRNPFRVAVYPETIAVTQGNALGSN